nr:hypothetical protein [Tanacetum cinerariifolium]
ILKKFDFMSVKTASTPIKTKKPLVKDAKAADVDVTPKTSHQHAVKRIFRYLKGQPKLGLWYPRESTFDLEAYSDSDYAGGNLDRKSTTGATLVEGRLIKLKVKAARLKLTTAKVYATEEKPIESEGFAQIINFLNESSVKIQASVDGKRVNIKESSIRRTLRLDDAEAFFSSQWKFLIHTILQCLSAKTTSWNEFNGTMASAIICLATNQKFNFSSAKTTSWNEFNDTMASAIICLATNQKFNFSRYILLSLVKKIKAGVPFFMFPRYWISREVTSLFDNMLVQAPKEVAKQNVPSPSNDLLPSGDDSLKLKELMDLCTNLSNKVLELESEAIDIKSTYQERIEKLKGKVESMMDVNEEEPADVEEVLEVVKAAKLMNEVVTIAGATKVNVLRKRRGVTIQDLVETTTIATVEPKVQAKDKGKAILIKEPKPLKRQAQIKLDEEVVR